MAPDRRARWDDLEAFRITADELSFTRAARRLQLTQPALSRRIQRLEAQVGAVLFERTTRRVTLTSAGHKLLVGATDLDAAWGRVETDLADSSASTTQTITDLTRPLPARLRLSAASFPAVRLLEALTDAYPDTAWHHQPFDHTASLKAVGTGGLDLALAFHVVHDPPETVPVPSAAAADIVIHGHRLPHMHLVDEPVWLAAGPRTPWADYEELSMADLATETWIARSGGPLRQLFDDACSRAGFTPGKLHIIDNNWPIRSLVTDGRAVTLCAATVAGEDVTVVPLLNAPRLRYSLIWSPEHLSHGQAHRIHRTLMTWYRTEAQRSRRYWAHILSHPYRFPSLRLPPA